MCARVGCVVAVLVTAAFAQDAQILIDLKRDHDELRLPGDLDRSELAELSAQLDAVRTDIMLLYTEHTARAGRDLKDFLQGIAGFVEEAVGNVPGKPDSIDTGDCRGLFELRLRRLKLNAYRAASFSGENHHKFILGHMIVFRMHINKTNEYLKKVDMALHSCGVVCEARPKIKRWKRLAAGELHRIRDDIQHTRRSYKDLVLHGKRRLNRVKKHLQTEAEDATVKYYQCLTNNTKV